MVAICRSRELNFFEVLIIMSLLLIAGIEPNPGPISENSVNSSTLSVSFDDLNAIKIFSCTLQRPEYFR